MPEGPTLFRLARDLDCFRRPDRPGDQPAGRPFAEDAAQLDGHRVESAESAGKHLFVRFDHDQVLHVHLGLDRWLPGRPWSGTDAGRPRRGLETPTSYADLRGATTCELVDEDTMRVTIGKLGPDPLRADDPAKAWHRIHRSSKPIGALLLDQRVLAGVGNVYRAESLFRARLHPLTPGVEVSRARKERDSGRLGST